MELMDFAPMDDEAMDFAALAGLLVAPGVVPPPYVPGQSLDGEPLAPGERFQLADAAVFHEQGDDHGSCCAHAVAIAVETRLVSANGTDPILAATDPRRIFAEGRELRSLHVSRRVAEQGFSTALGVHRASTAFLGACTPATMIRELHHQVPLMIEVTLDHGFRDWSGGEIYRPAGTLGLLHAMCVLGYGTDPITAEPFWVAKNSYGATWGEEGFVRLGWRHPQLQPERLVHAVRSVQP